MAKGSGAKQERPYTLRQAASVVFAVTTVLPLLVFAWALYQLDTLSRSEAQLSLGLALIIALLGFYLFRMLMGQISELIMSAGKVMELGFRATTGAEPPAAPAMRGHSAHVSTPMPAAEALAAPQPRVTPPTPSPQRAAWGHTAAGRGAQSFYAARPKPPAPAPQPTAQGHPSPARLAGDLVDSEPEEAKPAEAVPGAAAPAPAPETSAPESADMPSPESTLVSTPASGPQPTAEAPMNHAAPFGADPAMPGFRQIQEIQGLSEALAALWKREALRFEGKRVRVTVVNAMFPIVGTLVQATDEGLIIDDGTKRQAVVYRRVSTLDAEQAAGKR